MDPHPQISCISPVAIVLSVMTPSLEGSDDKKYYDYSDKKDITPIGSFLARFGFRDLMEVEMTLLPHQTHDQFQKFIDPENQHESIVYLLEHDLFPRYYYSMVDECIYGNWVNKVGTAHSVALVLIERYRSCNFAVVSLQPFSAYYPTSFHATQVVSCMIRELPAYIAQLIMPRDVINHVTGLLSNLGVKNSPKITAEEKVAIFLMIVGYNGNIFHNNTRSIGEYTGLSNHSLKGIFSQVSDALLKIAPRFTNRHYPDAVLGPVASADSLQPLFEQSIGFVGEIFTTSEYLCCGDYRDYLCPRTKTVGFNNTVIVGYDGLIKWVSAGNMGSIMGSHIYTEAVESGDVVVPSPKYLICDYSFHRAPYTLVPYANAEYRCHSQDIVTRKEYDNFSIERKFNYAHSMARLTMERTFSALKDLFPVLESASRFSTPRQKAVFTSCCVLYNILKLYDRSPQRTTLDNK